MLGTYYYHEIIRRTIIAFGTLFNEIDIKHQTAAGGAFSTVRVPIAYGPTEKFLGKIRTETRFEKESRNNFTSFSIWNGWDIIW